jgi:hypothetical protein
VTPYRDPVERFAEKVRLDLTTGCLLWTGAMTAGGYGRFAFRGHNAYSHRVSWELTFGPMPDGLVVMHRCDTPSCVNPDHLTAGTFRENMHDCVLKGRHVASRVVRTNNVRG